LLSLANKFQKEKLEEAEKLDQHIHEYELERGHVYIIGNKISSVSSLNLNYLIAWD
jgi:hypothetical protein